MALHLLEGMDGIFLQCFTIRSEPCTMNMCLFSLFLMKKTKKNPIKKNIGRNTESKSMLIGYVEKINQLTIRISAIHRKDPFPGIILEGKNAKEFSDGDVISYKITSGQFEFIEKIGNLNDPYIYALMALHRHSIPYVFTAESLKLAKKGAIPKVSQHRHDLRDIPFVTIDGEDAKDFDDAVYAEPLEKNEWKIIVAIADVSYYVTPLSALDHEARERGNSVYFPNTVVPMLPEALSNELCSLKPNVDRASLAVEIIITDSGKIKSFEFLRCLIKSRARLTYNQVQKAIDGKWSKTTKPVDVEMQNLFSAYRVLKKASTERGTINLAISEYKVKFNDHDHPISIEKRPDIVSQHIIEEMMILANVCAAKALIDSKCPSIFRVHDKPDDKRYTHLKDMLKTFGYNVPKAKTLTPHVFNEILKTVKGTDQENMLNDLVLRSQAQACYSPRNVGHFGLSLTHYTHFTSPIRRYSDLIVHRCLISALKLDEEELLPTLSDLEEISYHISKTERVAATAERETFERFAYELLQKEKGKILEGRITGLVQSGLFVSIANMGAEGFISIGQFKDDYYHFDEKKYQFIGRKKKIKYQLGQKLFVKIIKSDPLTCNLDLLPLLEKKSTKK